MGSDTLGRVLAESRHRNYIAPVDDESLGEAIFANGYGITHCRNDVQRAAWQRTQDQAVRQLRAMWLDADMQQIAA